MREGAESVRSKVGDFYFLEVPDPDIRCTTLHRKSNNLGNRSEKTAQRALGSIPTAPTITPDDSVALTLLGRVKRGRKSCILFPSCSQLNLISTRLRRLPLRPDAGSFHVRGEQCCVRMATPRGELGQFDSGDRIATVVLSHLASRWPHDRGGDGASNVRFELTTFGLFAAESPFSGKYRVVSVMAMFRQLCRCRGQLKTCFSRGGHLEYYLSQADSWGISSGGTHNVLGGRTLYE